MKLAWERNLASEERKAEESCAEDNQINPP